MKELKCLYFDFIKEKAYLKIISWWGRTVTFRLSCISRRADRGFKPKSFSLPPRLFPPGRAWGRLFPSGGILNYLDWWCVFYGRGGPVPQDRGGSARFGKGRPREKHAGGGGAPSGKRRPRRTGVRDGRERDRVRKWNGGRRCRSEGAL